MGYVRYDQCRVELVLIKMFPLLTLTVLTLVTASPVIDSKSHQSPNTLGNIPGFRTSDEDVIKQTRNMVDSTISILTSLAEDPTTSEYIDRFFSDKKNVCVGSLDEAIDGIEKTTELVENAGDDIKDLLVTINRFVQLNGTTKVVREVASIMRGLGSLIEKISSRQICDATPDETYDSIDGISLMLYEIAELPSLGGRSNVRTQLRKSASALYNVNRFLFYVRRTFDKFDKICSGEKEYNLEAINAIGDLMSHMADLFTSLGSYGMSERIRKGKLFTYKLTVSPVNIRQVTSYT